MRLIKALTTESSSVRIVRPEYDGLDVTYIPVEQTIRVELSDSIIDQGMLMISSPEGDYSCSVDTLEPDSPYRPLFAWHNSLRIIWYPVDDLYPDPEVENALIFLGVLRIDCLRPHKQFVRYPSLMPILSASYLNRRVMVKQVDNSVWIEYHGELFCDN